MTYDAIILGHGPAGMSAAIYLARGGNSVIAIGKGRGALERAEIIENYYGFPEPISGADLVDRGIAQAKRLGVEIVDGEAVSLGVEDSFVVKTADSEYRARAVLLATGKQRVALNVPGFEDLRGKGISFCATCDGFFYRGKKIAVVGTGDYAASELHELLAFSKDITLFTNGGKIASTRFPEGVRVVAEKITAFEGSEKLTAIRTADGEIHAADGAFVALGTAGAADFAAKVGVEVSGSDIVIDRDCMTNLPGIFAAGDCAGGLLQVAKAVAEGAIAAKGINAFLKSR